MKNKKTLLVAMSALALTAMSLAGCNNTGGTSSTSSSSSASGFSSSSSSAPATYTYREAITETPDSWNVHTWKENTQSIIFGYTDIGLYDFALGEGGKGYQIVPEMASGEPVDDSANVTAEQAKQFGMETAEDGSIQTGSKWLINLNEKACWEDGTAINADDYVGSMQRLLDPAMANFRADSWYSGDTVLGNAEGYFKSGRTIYSPYFDGEAVNTGTPVNDHYYGNLYTKIPWLSGYSFSGLVKAAGGTADILPKSFAILNDTDTWGTEASPKNVDLGTETTKATSYTAYFDAIKELNTALGWGDVPDTFVVTEGGANNSMGCFVLCGYANPVVDFANVGIKKVSDYQIALYLERPVSLFQLKYQLSGNWIVNIPLYDANKTTAGTLTSTTYATTAAKYKSYGPYKLTSFIDDKEIIVAKNDKWYGYTDGKHTGQYSISTVNMQVVSNLDTQLLMFERGDVDGISLRSQDMKKYSTSPYLMYTPQSYSDKIALNSSYTKLKERQAAAGDNINKVILSNPTFREALSWALDRDTFCQTETAGSTAALGVINKMYVADEASGTLYRDTDAGKRVLSDIYGTSTNGFNKTYASSLIAKACGEKDSAGNAYYTTGQKVQLEFVVYNEGWRTAIENHIEDFTDATVGTPLEGNFEVKITINENNQDTILAGNAELCMDIWGGAQMNPYGIPDTWIDPDNRTCYGFNPDSETIDIDLNADGEINKDTERKTNTDWYTALNDGEYSASKATYETRCLILSWLEEYMLENHYFITVRARNSVGIDSFRITEGADEYQALVGYGGIRSMKMTMSDQEWTARVKQGLDYTK